MIQIPAVNTVCAYTFTTRFASLNSIYTLAEILSFNEAISKEIDFVANLYAPAGLPATQYTTDAGGYINDSILLLIPTDTTKKTIYAPSSILAAIPDPMVGCYNNLAIGVSLGLFSDPTAVTWILAELNNIIGSVTGVVTPEIKLYSLGTKYMRVSDYESLLATRAAAQTAYATMYQQLQAQIALTTTSQNLNRYYQNTLITLA